jgi:hypothetical protein
MAGGGVSRTALMMRPVDLDKGVAATVSEYQPSSAYIAACKWMTEADLQVYSRHFQRTGFQGGLNY